MKLNKILTIALATSFMLCLPAKAFATTCTDNLMGLGVPAAQASAICTSAPDTLAVVGSATVGTTLVVTGASTQTGAMGFGSTFIGTGTSTIGWAVVAGANTACSTTCVTPCVFGVNTAATEADIVDCADATADECLCAGAS